MKTDPSSRSGMWRYTCMSVFCIATPWDFKTSSSTSDAGKQRRGGFCEAEGDQGLIAGSSAPRGDKEPRVLFNSALEHAYRRCLAKRTRTEYDPLGE